MMELPGTYIHENTVIYIDINTVPQGKKNVASMTDLISSEIPLGLELNIRKNIRQNYGIEVDLFLLFI